MVCGLATVPGRGGYRGLPSLEGRWHMELYQGVETSERMFPSTTWHWKSGSLRRGGAPESQSAVGRPSVVALRARDPRRSLDLQIRYVGGAEGTWQIQARGWRWLCTGGLSLSDVMGWINRSDA
jgi:hypothetical protein